MKDQGWVGAIRKTRRGWKKDKELKAIARAAGVDPRTVRDDALRLIRELGMEEQVIQALQR